MEYHGTGGPTQWHTPLMRQAGELRGLARTARRGKVRGRPLCIFSGDSTSQAWVASYLWPIFLQKHMDKKEDQNEGMNNTCESVISRLWENHIPNRVQHKPL